MTAQSIGRVALAAALVLSFGGAAHAARLALVIGNNAYAHVPPLRKALGDARAMKQALERLDFDVTLVENVNRKAFGAALDAFESKVEPGDEVVLHYSGHGIAMDGRNYLLPVDVEEPQPGRERQVRRNAYDAGEIVEMIREKKPKYVFTVLDACRNNPFQGTGRSVAATRGLARMEAEAGAFILFSAGPGEIALDRLSNSDPSPTSVFTRVLLRQLETPGMTLQAIAKVTQQKVRALAMTVGHHQFPDYSDRTLGEPMLLPGEAPVAAKPAAPKLDPAADTAFRLALLDGSEAALKNAVRQYPAHPRVKEVLDLLETRADDAAFKAARAADTAQAYRDYLGRPVVRHEAEARRALARLAPPPAAPAKPEAAPAPRADTGKLAPLRDLTGPGLGQIYSAVMSPDGRSIAAAYEGGRRIYLWDLAGGTVRTFEEHPGDIYALAFSPDGRLLASAGEDVAVRIWDVASGTVQQTLTDAEIPPRQIAFSPDGTLVAAKDTAVKLWKVETGELDLTLGDFGIDLMAFSPDGRTLVTSRRGKLAFWDPATGDNLAVSATGNETIETMVFTPDGRNLVTLDGLQHTAKIRDAATGAELRSIEIQGSLAISPDGRLVASGRLDTMTFREIATGRRVRSLEATSTPLGSEIGFSQDGRLLFSNAHPGSLWLWETRSGRLLARMIPLPGGEWAVADRKGYAVSPGAQEHLRLNAPGAAVAVDAAFRKRWLRETPAMVAVPGGAKP